MYIYKNALCILSQKNLGTLQYLYTLSNFFVTIKREQITQKLKISKIKRKTPLSFVLLNSFPLSICFGDL